MAKESGQKFIARNRAPRVQIEYDLETNGAMQKKQIPFVMGVLADLSGKSADELPEIEQRKALVTFAVPNKLTGEGQLAVDITFESMDDFSPAAIAKKIEPLAKLLEARTQLSNLVTYMDGKAGAEKLITQALQDPALLQSLASAPKPAE
jgi:type VI secretion system protein ImpB